MFKHTVMYIHVTLINSWQI